MTNKTETILEDSGIELVVDYSYLSTLGYYEDPTNISTWIPPSTYLELNTVELVIANSGIDITVRLSEKQKELIISKLTY